MKEVKLPKSAHLAVEISFKPISTRENCAKNEINWKKIYIFWPFRIPQNKRSASAENEHGLRKKLSHDCVESILRRLSLDRLNRLR